MLRFLIIAFHEGKIHSWTPESVRPQSLSLERISVLFLSTDPLSLMIEVKGEKGVGLGV